MINEQQIFDFKAVIFDLDGTLIDSEPLHLKAWNAVNEKYGVPLMSLDYMQQKGGISTVKICSMYFKEHGIQADYESIALEKTELYCNKFMMEARLNYRIASFLQKAHELGIKTAVATGSHLKETSFLLRKYRLLDCVDTIVTVDMIKNCKPAPDTYLEAAKRLQTAPKDCLVFEDTPIGEAGVKNAKMTCLRVFEDNIVSDFISS